MPADLDLSPLLVGVGLLVFGLYLNRNAIRERRLTRRLRRITRRADRLFAREDAVAATRLRQDTARLRRRTADAVLPSLAEALLWHADEHGTAGRMRSALAYAEEAAATADRYAERDPGAAVRPNLTLGRMLAVLDDDRAALPRLRQAHAYARLDPDRDPATDIQRVLVAANLSLVLRRAGAVDEAVQLARWAVTVDRGLDHRDLPAFTGAGTAYAHLALALALADAGQDGRAAAEESRQVWQTLIETGAFAEDETDGPAYARYALAYTLRPFDPAAAAAHARAAAVAAERLHARTPARYARLLTQAQALVRSLSAPAGTPPRSPS
ncbi:hypothetical protein ACFQY4_22725 [Catellatospora bangladeshensis]|uniref:hypothetical protein n=1 Tax=Catellatospora bangladeshensis TaxID=310355 RepID=UPI001944DFDA|nr:hypothetical protein [Catellatospora bangladeshensis]